MLTGWLLILCTVLAVARLTRLITTDYILDPARAWVAEHAPDSVVYLISCPWCLSWWLGLAGGAVVYVWHDQWPVQVTLLGLAASYLTGLLEQISSLLTHTDEQVDR